MTKDGNHLIKNIYYMLSYAYQTLRETGYENVAAEDFENLHDLFAAILVKGVSAQVKRGLHRDYLEREEALPGVRGQILVAETIKRQTWPQVRLVCSYDEFFANSPHNQALKSVMLLLMRKGKVKPKNKTALRKLFAYFSEVSEVSPSAIKWSAFKYHRNNAPYQMLLGVCRLVVEGLLQTTDAGKYKLSSWLQGEAMHKLYENFLFNYYRTEHRALSVSAPYIKWAVDRGEAVPFLPVMRTDVVLQNANRRLIIDAKYLSHTMQYGARYNSKAFISGNMYQIYAYVKNCAASYSGEVAGALLYAMTDEAVTPDEDTFIGGNRFFFKTLDLNCNWETVKTQLNNLCGWLL